eukprot:scaffold23627_cov60-Phaeocystis_antarctica.AAC.1
MSTARNIGTNCGGKETPPTKGCGKRPGPLVTACQKEALSKAGRLPLNPIPAVPVRVSHFQGAHCARRHCQWHARGVWRAAAERGAIGAAEAPANFI